MSGWLHAYNGRMSAPSTAKLKPKALFALLRKHRGIFLRYKGALVTGVVMLVVVNVLLTAIPWQIKQAVDGLQQNGKPIDWAGFYRHLWIISGLAFAMLLARIASRQCLLGAGKRIEADMRNRLFGHLLRMPTSYYAAHPAGELMSRMTNDVDATRYLTGGGIMLGVNTILAYGLAIPMMLLIDWRLSLVTFVLYPVMIRIMTTLSRKVRKGYYDVQNVLADISTVANENLNGMSVIQSYVLEDQENARFRKVCDDYFDVYTRLINERILLFMVLAGLSGVSTLILLVVGGAQVIGGKLDWGGFVAYTMYLEQLAWPTMALGWTISIFQQGTAALERIDEVLGTESEIQHAETLSGEPDAVINGKASAPAVFRGEIEIRDLTFAYDNPYMQAEAERRQNRHGMEEHESLAAFQPAHPVLRDIDLHVRPGETIALVGPVGSGKSTLLRLLPRLYDLPKDKIFLDDKDITELPLETLRAAMVFMPQLSFLFSSTVSQNIAFGRPELLREELNTEETNIIPVAEIASVHEDILKLPDRYQTLVGERGLMLSGGQRQRVTLARAILMDAPVLILDDPFSNVDAETERQIVNALSERKVFQQKTTLIATHRFSLVALCDRIVLMDAGRILAVGSHEELIATQPLYQRLHKLQELRATLGEWEMTGPEPVAAIEEDDG